LLHRFLRLGQFNLLKTISDQNGDFLVTQFLSHAKPPIRSCSQVQNKQGGRQTRVHPGARDLACGLHFLLAKEITKWRRRQIYAPMQVASAQPRQAGITAAIIVSSMKMISKPAAAADILNAK
jgi:hypothetical protein